MFSEYSLYQIISPLDWIIFFSVLLLTLLSVLWGNYLKKRLPFKEQTSLVELLLMGRKLTLPLFVATLVSTWYGGIFGVTALTFEKGIFNFVTQGLFWYFSYFIFALYLVKKIRSFDAVSLPDIAGKIFGPKAEKITALLNFFNLLPLAYTISLGLFLRAIFGGDLLTCTSIGVILVTIYSLWGGFRAVVFSDLVQFIFMIVAVIIVVIFSWMKLGTPQEMWKLIPASHKDWTGGESIEVIFIWGFIALSTLVDPNFYQRCLAAKSEKTAKMGILISIFIWFIFDCCTTIGALYARAYFPHLNPQDAYLYFSMTILPSGVRGLLLSGVLATILSTLDSYLFNAATCLSYDLLSMKSRFKNFHHHLALIFVSLLSIMLGHFFDGNIIAVWKILGSLSSACLLFPLLLGQIFPGKITEFQFIMATLTGCLGIIAWRIVNYFYPIYPLDEFYIGLFLTSSALIPSIIKKNPALT